MKTILLFTLSLLLPIAKGMFSLQRKHALEYEPAVIFHKKINEYFNSHPNVPIAAIEGAAGLAKLIRFEVSKVYLSPNDQRVVIIYCGPDDDGEVGIYTGLSLAEYQINVWLVFDSDPNQKATSYLRALKTTGHGFFKDFIKLKYMSTDTTKTVMLVKHGATKFERGSLPWSNVFGVVDAICGLLSTPQEGKSRIVDNHLIMMEELHKANENGVESYSLDVQAGVDPTTGNVVVKGLPDEMSGNRYRQPKHVVFIGCIKAMVFRNPYQFYYIVSSFIMPSVVDAFKKEKSTAFRLPGLSDYNGALHLMLT